LKLTWEEKVFLEMVSVDTFFGESSILQGISLEISEGETIAILGANGSGKTTLLKTISGLIRPRFGEIWFEERRIDRLPPEQIVRRGISQCPEGRRLFPYMSVIENLQLGAYCRLCKGEKVREDQEKIYQLFPRLKEREKQMAGTLSGGEQQMLAMGRALMAGPKLLMLDEPSLGLAPLVVREIFSTVREINQGGISILLVEQNAVMALNVASRGYVLEMGRVVLTDRRENLLKDERVRQAYLGG
jgi:branched-chain amino acid transport system ATP-binding protein